MTTTKKKKIAARKKPERKFLLSLTSKNYILFGIGMLTIVLGYIFMAQGPWDSFWSLTLAPILLVIAYAIIIPIAIMYRQKGEAPKKTGGSEL